MSMFVCIFLTVAVIPYVVMHRWTIFGTEFIPTKIFTSWIPGIGNLVK